MQDRFGGDVGDFGKYGLLRALAGVWPDAMPRFSLGVGPFTDLLHPPDVVLLAVRRRIVRQRTRHGVTHRVS